MAKSIEKQFLVTVTCDALGGDCRTHVQKISGDASAIKNLSVESGEEFVIDAKTAMSVYSKSRIIPRSAPTAASNTVSIPQAQSPNSNVPMVAGAWGTIAGGWATLASRSGGASIANHGNYLLDDGIARVAAGEIVPGVDGSSWTALPGGWSALANGNIPTPHASVSQSATAASSATTPIDGIAIATAAVVTGAVAPAAPSIAPTNPAPVAAAPSSISGAQSLAWAAMAGGWATLSRSISSEASPLVTQPVLKKTNQVAAGSIISNDEGDVSQFPSWASMPGGWSKLASI